MNWPVRLAPLSLIALLTTLIAVFTFPCSGRDLIGTAAIWKYLDYRATPSEGWRQRGFDDADWKSGQGPLGYGESRLKTTLSWGKEADQKPFTTWFRHEFAVPEFKPGERLVLLLCADDGAVVFLNGQEVARANMEAGPLTNDAPARHDLADAEEGFYSRFPIPPATVHPGETNMLAVEVDQSSSKSDDLFFDLALKSLPMESVASSVPVAAREVMTTFRQRHGPKAEIAAPAK